MHRVFELFIIMNQHLKALFFIFLLGFLAFSNGLNNPFLIDDHAFFEDEKLQNIKYLPLHFLPDKNRALHIEGESADPFYRPLATVIPMLSYLAFKDNTTGFHVTNLILFCLAGWGIYLFLRRLGASYIMALLAAVFYVIHPINGVSVNYITASVFSAQVMLMLASLYFLDSPFLSCFLYLLSTFCHETAMLLPGYALIFVAVLSDATDLKAKLREAWAKVWPLFVVLGLLMIFRMFYSSLQASILNKISQYDMTFPQYLATWTMLLSWYLSRLLWPWNIVLIMAHQPLKSGLGVWLLLLPVLLALAAYLMWYYRRSKIVLIGLAWFFLGFAPFILACFFQPIHGLMIEPHWFLFPVIGFFIFLAAIFENMLTHAKVLARSALVIIVFTLVFFSRWQNFIWGDEVRYCTFWLAESPAFVAVNAYIAKAYELRGENDLARQHYRYILKRGYKSYIAYTNMGLMDLKEGKWESAKKNLLQVMAIDPHASMAVSDLGVIYFKQEEYKKALEYFKRARDLNRFTIMPYLDIAQASLKLNDRAGAIQALEEALQIVPGEEHAMVDLIKIYIDGKDRDNIVRIARMMVNYSRNPYTLGNAGTLLKYYGLQDEAEIAFDRARMIMDSARNSGAI